MFLPRKPSAEAIGHFIASQKGLPYSYDEVGATELDTMPKGYVEDRYREKLGEGEEVYRRAVEALRGWRQFDLGWVRLVPAGAPIEVGATVAVLARHLGFWSLNSARIVYTVDEQGDEMKRFGFGYGTLPGHAERGEERFVVEWDRESNSVHYDVFAFSRPNDVLAWFGFPFARLFQRRFARDSKAAMARATRQPYQI